MDICEEIWKDLIGFDRPYQISNYGNVKCLEYTKIDIIGRKQYRPEHYLSLITHSSGYIIVNIRKDNKSITKRVHRLVAEAFLENPNNKPVVDHIDGNKTNNKVSNLRWSTYQENTLNPNTFNKAKISLIKSIKSRIKPVYKLDSNYKVLEKFDSAEDAAKAMNCSSVFIHRCCTISTRTAKGFHWSYAPIKLQL